MNKWVNAILLFIFLGTVACKRTISHSDASAIEKQKFADAILYKVAAKIKKETNLRPCGTIGQMLNKVQVLGLAFNYYEPIDIAEGRRLLIDAVNSMMEEVNNTPRIRPYLGRYPFTPWNVEIEIYLYNHDGRFVTPGNLSIVVASERILRYKINDPATSRLVTIYEETYEEGLARLNDPTLPLVPFHQDQGISQEELERLRKGISLVTDDGSIFHLDENGMWSKDAK